MKFKMNFPITGVCNVWVLRYFWYMYLCLHCVCWGVCCCRKLEVSHQTSSRSHFSAPTMWVRGVNSGCQAWWQVPSPLNCLGRWSVKLFVFSIWTLSHFQLSPCWLVVVFQCRKVTFCGFFFPLLDLPLFWTVSAFSCQFSTSHTGVGTHLLFS